MKQAFIIYSWYHTLLLCYLLSKSNYLSLWSQERKREGAIIVNYPQFRELFLKHAHLFNDEETTNLDLDQVDTIMVFGVCLR